LTNGNEDTLFGPLYAIVGFVIGDAFALLFTGMYCRVGSKTTDTIWFEAHGSKLLSTFSEESDVGDEQALSWMQTMLDATAPFHLYKHDTKDASWVTTKVLQR
jgi:hypothetical protein